MEMVVAWVLIVSVAASNPPEGSEHTIHIAQQKLFRLKFLGCRL